MGFAWLTDGALPNTRQVLGSLMIIVSSQLQWQSWCNSLGAGGPSMHGIALRYS